MTTGIGVQRQEQMKCCPYFQKGQEGGSKELQASQTHPAWEGDGTVNLENHFKEHEGE